MAAPAPTPDWATALLGADAVLVSVVAGGSSRETLLLEVPAGPTRIVARHDRGAGPLSGTPFTLAREAATFAAATGAGIPVPALVAVAPDGRSFAVEEVPGSPETAAVALDDYLRCLGRLHATGIDLAPTGHLGFDAAGREDLVAWQTVARERIERSAPILEHAFDRLRHHGAFAPSEVVLCHGDAGPGNYLHEGARVTGLIDWEMSHTGDPHDDLASIAVRSVLTGIDLGDYRRRIAAHHTPAAGVAFDEQRFRVAVAAVLTRMVVSCLSALDHPDAGTDRTIQLLGLPLMEVHLLRTLAQLDGHTLPPVEAPVPDPTFAAELAAAITDGMHRLAPCAGDRAAGPARRLGYASKQLARSLRSAADNTPSPMSDADPLWSAARRRLAVLPSSRRLADAPIAGAS